ncbi:MAG TPA: phosphate ABC transporter substrate-binding protein PstS [Candidatus Saccharimonadales bacterium]|nr:phosphate ABC transporter substrate-binding protein PstS [Candidatus Saccharimonadales bacterium]
MSTDILRRAPRSSALAALLSLALTLAAAGPAPAAAASLTGAGATFPYPLYSKWFDEYAKANPGTNINYQSIGSGGGIRQITERTVDFGASDPPMTEEQIGKAPGVLHIPTVIGAVVVVYNLAGVPAGLKLDGETVAAIFLGQITSWNDPKVAALNPGVSLPAQAITVVHRSDGSGTTNIFTDYLSHVSTAWAKAVGKSTSVNWPVGLGAKGNEGVAGQVRTLPGTIGYVELAYAMTNKMTYASVRNRAGEFVEPSVAATTTAAAGAVSKMPADLRVSIVNPPGKHAYPICGFTYLLVYREQGNRTKGEVLAKFLWWAIHDGQRMAEPLYYAPLPPPVVSLVEAKVKSLESGGSVLLK